MDSLAAIRYLCLALGVHKMIVHLWVISPFNTSIDIYEVDLESDCKFLSAFYFYLHSNGKCLIVFSQEKCIGVFLSLSSLLDGPVSLFLVFGYPKSSSKLRSVPQDPTFRCQEELFSSQYLH